MLASSVLSQSTYITDDADRQTDDIIKPKFAVQSQTLIGGGMINISDYFNILCSYFSFFSLMSLLTTILLYYYYYLKGCENSFFVDDSTNYDCGVGIQQISRLGF